MLQVLAVSKWKGLQVPACSAARLRAQVSNEGEMNDSVLHRSCAGPVSKQCLSFCDVHCPWYRLHSIRPPQTSSWALYVYVGTA